MSKGMEASETITEDYVVSTKPAAGEELPAGATIYLSISGGPELVKLEMPNLIGKTQSGAVSAIEQAGLTLGSISAVESSYTEGTVFWQNIDAGETISKGTVVYLKVSTGPAETPEPTTEPTAEPTAPSTDTPVQPTAPATEPTAPTPVEGGTA